MAGREASARETWSGQEGEEEGHGPAFHTASSGTNPPKQDETYNAIRMKNRVEPSPERPLAAKTVMIGP